MVANQLENTLPISVKEKAYTCAITLLNEKRIEKESPVSIEKTDNGYNVNCRISGGDMDLVSIDVYAPDIKQAKIMKKNFHRNPELVYKLIMGSLTKNKNIVNECLEEIKSSR